MSLPEGYGHVPGRSTAKAIKLLGIASDLGLEPSVIHGVTGGYDVPEAVLDEYDKHLDSEDSVIATTADQSFQRIETNHAPLTFDTTHPDEDSNFDGTAAAPSAAQAGASIERTLAEGERTDDLPERRTTADKHELAREGAPVVDAQGSTPAVDAQAEEKKAKEAADAERAEEERRAALTEDERKAEDEVARRAALTDEERAAEDAANSTETPDDAPVIEKPAGNASQADWLAYAKSKGYDGPDDAGRDDLRDSYSA
jgi:hypothetical protein